MTALLVGVGLAPVALTTRSVTDMAEHQREEPVMTKILSMVAALCLVAGCGAEDDAWADPSTSSQEEAGMDATGSLCVADCSAELCMEECLFWKIGNTSTCAPAHPQSNCVRHGLPFVCTCITLDAAD